MKCTQFLKKIWHFLGKPDLPPEPKTISDFKNAPDYAKPLKGIVTASSVGWIRQQIEKDVKTQRIANLNRKRRSKFSNAEHFKQRQPTTARKLWKPNAKLEED
jgi:hypothetical protein